MLTQVRHLSGAAPRSLRSVRLHRPDWLHRPEWMHRPEGRRPDRPRHPGRARPAPTAIWNAALTVAAVLAAVALGWQQRWISDDGLIVLRTVRQLLAGHGPVVNIGERVEANTSTAWTAILALVGLLPGVGLEPAAVGLGLALSAAGFGFGVDAARRLHLPAGGAALLPFGVVVLLAVSPMRDFLTSGLETGLITFWLAFAWWLLVRLARGARDGALPRLAAVTLGVGPLVRPDLGVFAVAGLLALVALLRPRWPRLLALGAASAVLPVSYEIFRAGYYGLLVPNTALAKEASGRRWSQGVDYLQDTVATYWLWIPLTLALLGMAAVLTRAARAAGVGGWADRRAALLVAAVPLVSGLLMALFVVRVGGDFMHGRMLLPALTAFLLPMFALPFTRWTVAAAVGVAVWAGVCVTGMRVEYGSQISATGIVDERAFWSQYLAVDNPVRAADFIAANGSVRTSVSAMAQVHGPAVMMQQGGLAYAFWRWYPARPGIDHITISYLNLGMMAAAHPLDVRVIDNVGLSNPIAAHVTPVFGGRVGHNKDLPPAWYAADEVRADVPMAATFPQDVADARAALRCPRIAEMLDSVRAPLTAERFWANLRGAVDRTELRFSRIPQHAAQCDS